MKNQIINKMINSLKNYTFSLYLLHWYILQTMLKHFAINEASIVYRLSAPFIALGITIIITKLIRKVPIINKILP
jgi:peptidoglycan/LPS O-acetylase OafA/YrhL